jgi:hypothetical protein
MTRNRIPSRLGALLLAGLLLAGCSDDDPVTTGSDAGTLMPDFTLVDVNPTSTTHNEGVSPRDYLQKVSAWYFGHAT